ncbi:amino acid ABC transporter ATP-binding/permease protein [Falcatimonas sp. MSJ-15]|uniref:amino acid ABC transporter ATP-binding/permease protein n=1 Tax=Falcatimonas sp. MSJ-15 TaxID=2841515 RepID=UPI0020A1D860|nr:ABC transporter ATP-binding protein [Falcatimonas sp. MSJ-15]
MKNRSGLGVMMGLIGLVRPLILIMLAAIILGCIGNLFATFITVLGGYGLLNVTGINDDMSLSFIFTLIAIFAISRGILRYSEQACNHYIAFKLLARIRHEVFKALRRLAPAKLDGREKGNLIALITSDIELLEVFYAHTISPIMIAIITSIFMSIFIGRIYYVLGILALLFYIIVGAIIPIINGRIGKSAGEAYRREFGSLNSTLLDNLYGLDEILQYNVQDKRNKIMLDKTDKLEDTMRVLKYNENVQKNITDIAISLAGIIFVICNIYFVKNGTVTLDKAVISTIAIMSSFGPTAALSALSNNLTQTLACGNRVLNLLNEEPVTYENVNGKEYVDDDVICDMVDFVYDADSKILDKYTHTFTKNKIHGIFGKSGCGKSTLIKLMMRFYETQNGTINYGNNNVNDIKTKSLRKHVAYVTQETFLFNDTIENNIKVANNDATHEQVIEAAKKASIHDFIESLPNGYDTVTGEMGDGISGGEKQRIGLARAFLHNSELMLLDEPTSNIDSLNEGIILKSLREEKKDKTVILVSHRRSTMGICDDVAKM